MRSLTLKLTLAFLGVSLTGIGLVALLVWGITAAEFNRFVTDRGLDEYARAATAYYEDHGSWAGVEGDLRGQRMLAASNQPRVGNGNGVGMPPPPYVLTDSHHQVIIAFGPYRHGDVLPEEVIKKSTAITSNNQIVGYVIQTGSLPNRNPFEERYWARTNQALILAALGAVIIAVLLGLFLARTITRPVRELTIATSAMAKGQLNQQVQVHSRDELGALSRAFNKMSADLENSNHLRQQMTADIAHDLRTPLSVIIGYLEGLKDGVIKPSPKRFTAMYDEAIYLQRLVEDLRTLSLADSGELSMNYQPVQPADLIERIAASYQHQAEQNQIKLETEIDASLPVIRVDPERIQQALSNLVSNAIRYTPEEGIITLSARTDDGSVYLAVKDTGAGIQPDVLPHVFERFYRGDNSRQEIGSGLGLAIAKSIVELQGGKISAFSEGPGTGSQFTIQLFC